MLARLSLAAALLVGLPRAAAGQDAPEVAPTSPWEFSASVFLVDPPGFDPLAAPILIGRRGPLHLELRYNYEDLDTVSFFTGWSFTTGEEVALEITPMLGVVAGATDGIAPGLELDLGWRRIAWYAEMEYLFDSQDSSDDFFFSWSTLTYGVTDWLAAGVVTHRTRLVETDFEVQMGLALEFAYADLELALYGYNLGTNDAFAVLSLGASF